MTRYTSVFLAPASALALAFTVVTATAPSPAYAQPAGKVDAKQLMQTGVKLLEQKDYLGALAIFKEAYQRFPSAKILLNIGTTLKLLDRKAEAANAYQRYLDSSDADPARRTEVTDALAELDKWLGRVRVGVEPADAEIEVDGEWLRGARLVHVEPGGYQLHVRRDGFQPAERQLSLVGGQQLETTVALVAIPKPAVNREVVTVHDQVPGPGAASAETGPRPRFGAIAAAHISVVPRVGSAWLIGATADATEQLSIDAGLLLGPGLVSHDTAYMYAPPSYGAYIGASFAFLTGPWRPRVGAGLPIFWSSGARVALRGAAGLEYVASKHLAFILELGVERNLNPQSDIDNTALVPAFSASGRL